MIFVDRSRYKSFFHCPMERFLGYHIYKRGIVYEASSIPLATGSHAHKAVEIILKGYLTNSETPTSEAVRHAIETANNEYMTEIGKHGFSEIDEARVTHTLNEQTTLISGLIWSWASYILPPFLEEFEVLHVEQEMERIIGCDCGLKSIGPVAVHIERDCNGLCIMTRPDIVARNRISNSIVYVELKTGGKIESGTFEGDVQFAFGAAGIEGYTGEELSASYVHGLVKGYRPKAYNYETGKKDGPKYQASSLCYAYVKPGIDGMVPADIKFKYGKGVTKQHKKTPVWEIEFPNRNPDIPPIEHYVSLMEDEQLESHVRSFGPYPYPRQQVEEMLLDIEHLERRNDEVFKFINGEIEDKGLGHDDVQALLHEFIPKSWGCRQWGDQICQYHDICTKQNGWDEPCRYMDYVARDLNHPIEGEFDV